jgi:hypothetical protein
LPEYLLAQIADSTLVIQIANNIANVGRADGSTIRSMTPFDTRKALHRNVDLRHDTVTLMQQN